MIFGYFAVVFVEIKPEEEKTIRKRIEKRKGYVPIQDMQHFSSIMVILLIDYFFQ